MGSHVHGAGIPTLPWQADLLETRRPFHPKPGAIGVNEFEGRTTLKGAIALVGLGRLLTGETLSLCTGVYVPESA